LPKKKSTEPHNSNQVIHFIFTVPLKTYIFLCYSSHAMGYNSYYKTNN
jgi:hypothetical protein